MTIRTEIKPHQYAPLVYAVVLVDDVFVLPGPPRLTEADAVEEALRFYREGAHERRPMRPEEQVSYGVDRDVKTVSSMIHGKLAADYWSGR